jgi:hypothetical protein
MQRGRYIHLAMMAGAFVVLGWSGRPALADLTPTDIGGPGAAGSTTAPDAKGQIVQKGSGANIGGTSDQFQYAYQKLSGDGSISAELLSQSGGGDSARSGVMIRASTDKDSPYALLAMSSNPEEGVRLEHRPRKGENPQDNVRDLEAPQKFPTTLRLERRGDYIYAWGSQDGGRTYQRIAYSVTLESLGGEALYGLATTSHKDGDLTTSTFDQVTVSNDLLPDPVNVVLTPGDKSVTVTWDSAAATGVTFNVFARVADKATPTPPIGKDWVRVNTDPIKTHSFLLDGLDNSTQYEFAVTAVVKGVEGARQRPEPRHTGLFGPVTPMAPLKIGGIDGWVLYNIGTEDPGRVSVDNNGKITIEAGGTDTWENSDGMSFLTPSMPIEGDFVATARIVSGPTAGAATNGWTDGALEVKETLQPSSRLASVQVANMQPIQLRTRYIAGRTPENTTINDFPDLSTSAQMRPLWFRLTRKGDAFHADFSLDATDDVTKVNWLPLGNDGGPGSPDGPSTVTIPGFAKSAYVGIRLQGNGEGGPYSHMEVDHVAITKG